ncbi:MAG TPA: RNA polymerase subunit sigma-24 [Peptococcaceae bacterium]|jgi:RNA polymerase sigma factor (sigma-70 family)|nr:RNA polymerase subunit sigma-24 [Peptococcaceae bacterium]
MNYAMSDNLVQRYLDGDQDAFALLVEKYKGYVFAIILSFVRDEETAKDIAQEVFLQIYRSLATYQQQNIKGWIGRIAANKAIDYKRKKHVSLCELETAERIQGKDDGSGSELEKMLLQKEKKTRVKRVLLQLPPIYKMVLYKFYFQDKGYQEIAHEEGIQPKTVESRLYRARKAFRQEWGDETNETL